MTRESLIFNRFGNLGRLGVLALGLSIALCSPASGRTIVYVDENADQEPHDGSSWCRAYLELYDALDAVSGETVIRVADGSYSPDSSGLSEPRQATFQLISSVTIEGGYAGCGAADPDERDPAAHETILDGNGSVYHVVTGSGTDATAVLDGFTVTGGYADGEDLDRTGGGMLNHTGSPTVTKCSFVHNIAESLGGGMYNINSSIQVLDSRFSDNSLIYHSGWGGAVSNRAHESSMSPVFIGCTFTANDADEGAAMDTSTTFGECYLTVIDCVFTANEVDGLAVMVMQGDVFGLIEECAFVENAGGGVSNWENTFSISNCVFTDNLSSQDGGAVFNAAVQDSMIDDCIFSGNSAWTGGAIYNYAIYSYDVCEPSIVNCIFDRNSAGLKGGAIFNAEYDGFCRPAIVNCTFTGNSAGEDGGAFGGAAGTSPEVVNCIIWGNEPDEISEDASVSLEATYSCVQGGYDGEGNIDADPLFVDPDGADDIFGTEDDDLRLSAGSPCIDAGNNDAVPEDITTDLDDNPRFVDDPDTQDTGLGEPPIVDMGCYEFQVAAPCPADITGDGTVDVLDLLAILSAWGTADPDADINGDGIVDVLDLLIVLSAWGPCD